MQISHKYSYISLKQNKHQPTTSFISNIKFQTKNQIEMENIVEKTEQAERLEGKENQNQPDMLNNGYTLRRLLAIFEAKKRFVTRLTITNYLSELESKSESESESELETVFNRGGMNATASSNQEKLLRYFIESEPYFDNLIIPLYNELRSFESFQRAAREDLNKCRLNNSYL